MKTRNQRVEAHSFYCLNCGERGLDVVRRKAKLHESGHLKNLYCWHCKKECNHYECLTPFDVEEFQMLFQSGELKEKI